MMTDAEANQPVTKREANALTAAVDGLADSQRVMNGKFKTQARILVAVVLGLVLVCATGTVASVALIQVRHENACVAALASASADRTGALAPLSTERSNASDARQDAEAALILTLIPATSETQSAREISFQRALSAFHAAAENYQQANEAYQQAYQQNPPPTPKKFTC